MILDHIEQWRRSQPSRTALVCNGRTLSYEAFARAIGGVRRFLAAQALPPRGLAVVLAADLLNAWLLVLAARSLGLTTVHVATLSGLAPLRLKGFACVLVAEPEQALASAPGPELAGVRLVVAPASALSGADGRAEPPPTQPAGDHILYTSGTTGAYKKLLFESALEDQRSQERARVSEFSPETVFHALDFGLWTGIGYKSASATWHAGGCVVIDQTEARYADFLKHQPTYAQTLPESLRALVAARAPQAAPSETLLLRVGGGFTPLSLAEQALARLSRRLVIGFSATELCTQIMKSQFHVADDLNWMAPLPGRVVQVVDEDGVERAAGVEGELRFALTSLDSTAYLDDEAATARVFRGGFFYSGDLAVRREDGRIRIVGRTADVINIRGQKLAVGPIEERLQQGLGVDEVCLFSRLADDGVEELVVAVRAQTPLAPDEVERRLGGSVLFDRVRVEVLADFPRTHTGKTRRGDLRRMLFPGSP